MIEKKEEMESENGVRFFSMILPSLPSFTIKFFGLFLKFKSDANKAGKIFQKELINQGIEESTATNLTNLYKETGNIANYIKLFRKI